MKESTKTIIKVATGFIASSAVSYTGYYATAALSCLAVACGHYKSAVVIGMTGAAITFNLSLKAYDAGWSLIDDEIIAEEDEKPVLKTV